VLVLPAVFLFEGYLVEEEFRSQYLEYRSEVGGAPPPINCTEFRIENEFCFDKSQTLA
jgi:hypothetical protein